jgi:hypothetical protein
MIERKTLLALNFYKKEAFTGSWRGMRYRIAKEESEEGACLKAACWPEPFNFEKTPEEKKIYEKFAFSEEGLCRAADWLNEKYQEGNYDTGHPTASI